MVSRREFLIGTVPLCLVTPAADGPPSLPEADVAVHIVGSPLLKVALFAVNVRTRPYMSPREGTWHMRQLMGRRPAVESFLRLHGDVCRAAGTRLFLQPFGKTGGTDLSLNSPILTAIRHIRRVSPPLGLGRTDWLVLEDVTGLYINDPS